MRSMHRAPCPTETRRRPRLLALLLSAAVVLAAMLAPTAMAAGWSDVAPGPLNVDRADTATGASVADVGGTPYTAWAESTPDGARSYVFAARYSGGAWEGVGGLIDQHGADPQITSIGGLPYLAYAESSGQVYVAYLNNGAWQTIGGAPLAAQINDSRNQAQWVSIAGDRHGNPYVAWSENSAGHQSRVYVSAYLHGAWYSTTPGHSLNFDPGNLGAYPRIANINGTLWVTWLEHFSDGWRVLVEYYNGTQWIPAGAPQVGTIGTDADAPNIADVGGVPYLSWIDVTGSDRVLHVARYDAHATPNWVRVGGAIDEIGPPRGGGDSVPPGLADVGGVPWVTWTEPANGPVVHVHVAELAAGQWQPVFGPLNADPGKSAIFPTIASVGGQPYVGFLQETTNDTSGSVVGTPWQLHVEVPQRQMPLSFTSLTATPSQDGTKFSVGLTGPAEVRLDFTQSRPGRRIHGGCVAPSAGNWHRPACARPVTVRTLRFHGHAGTNVLTWSQTLRSGRYRVRVTATSPAGQLTLRRWLTITL